MPQTIKEPCNNQHHRIRTGTKGVKDEEEEIFVISDSHTVVNPGAVVIVSIYTDETECAVTASWCSNHLAVGA